VDSTSNLVHCGSSDRMACVLLMIILVRSDIHNEFEYGSFVLVPELGVLERMLEHVKKLFEESKQSEHLYAQGNTSRRAFRFINDFEQVGASLD
jgi:hypothetical protein